jgi:hypothetical protein
VVHIIVIVIIDIGDSNLLVVRAHLPPLDPTHFFVARVSAAECNVAASELYAFES